MAYIPRCSFTTWRDRNFKWYPVPGCKIDPNKRFGKFRRWEDRPDAAIRLYWKTHPEAYNKMCVSNNPKEKVSMTQYNNPVPVAVTVAKIYAEDGSIGLVGVIRGIEPKIDEDALPGGFVDEGESIEVAAAREFSEEVGYTTSPSQWVLQKSAITPNNRVLIFCLLADILPFTALADFKLNPEVKGFKILKAGDKLAFPLHQNFMEEFLAKVNS